MCISPLFLKNIGLVSCRTCWQCRKNRVNDLVGRCIAESHTAGTTLAVTLTYGGGDNPNAAMLVYRDVQEFFKRLRRAGHKVRYLVAGEYGSKKGRAHWHAILFFEGAGPSVEKEKRISFKHWPHGYAFFETPRYKAFRYCLKYVLKDETSEVAKGHLSMSKMPPLGHHYFKSLAEQYATQGLAPQNFRYSFRDERDDNGERRQFLMQGKTRSNFLASYCEAWEKINPQKPMPYSDVVEEYQDKIAASNPGYQASKMLRQFEENAGPFHTMSAQPYWDADGNRNILSTAYEIIDGEVRYVARDISGKIKWQGNVAKGAQRAQSNRNRHSGDK